MTEKHENHPGAAQDSRPVWMQELAGIALRVQANPLPYAAGLLVILASLAAGGLYQLLQAAQSKDASTDFASAVFTEDEAARIAALEAVADKQHAWSDEALYLLAEERLAKKELDAAAQAYQDLLSSHPESEWAPRAAEGLAYIDELNGVLVDAIGGYERVRDQWPDSFTARLQPYNIGRASESMGDMARAVDEYERQLAVFPESRISAKAQTALDRLRRSNPELFPEDSAAAPAESPAEPEAVVIDTPPAEEPALDTSVTEAAVGVDSGTAGESTVEPAEPAGDESAATPPEAAAATETGAGS